MLTNLIQSQLQKELEWEWVTKIMCIQTTIRSIYLASSPRCTSIKKVFLMVAPITGDIIRRTNMLQCLCMMEWIQQTISWLAQPMCFIRGNRHSWNKPRLCHLPHNFQSVILMTTILIMYLRLIWNSDRLFHPQRLTTKTLMQCTKTK